MKLPPQLNPKHIYRSLRRGVKHQVCRLYRSVILRRVVFIGVTGSCGKTTTTDLIVAVLSTRFRGRRNPEGFNVLYNVVRRILETSPKEDFCAIEICLGEKTPIDLPIRMTMPQIGVVTHVGMDHFDHYRSVEAIAEEKGKLVAALPANGTAVLNADDARVLAMQHRCAGSIISYGVSSTAMLRAEDIRGDWPNRLSFTALSDGDSVRVSTQLCGLHWVSSVLAALAVGKAMGVPLAVAAEAISKVPPFPGRMSPVTTPNDITFIRDDIKVPVWTIPAALDFMRRASAERKIMIVGTLSDYQEPLDPTYARVARQARDVSDFVFFVGRWASRCLRARRSPDDQSIQAFVTAEHLTGFLKTFLQPGDLVLIKGSLFADHLEGIVSNWLERTKPPESDLKRSFAQNVAPNKKAHWPTDIADAVVTKCATQIVVGLGNPEKKYDRTPHNVGQRAIKKLADQLQANWQEIDFGFVARAQVDGYQLLMIRPAAYMNESGIPLLELSKIYGISHEKFVLIHDDINLKLGEVRNRLSGSSGGHKGVQSIIAAFQSENIRRVKIGVGFPDKGTTVTDYVLTPFGTKHDELIDKACRDAATRILEMTTLYTKQNPDRID